jgi:aspartyl protease family protein
MNSYNSYNSWVTLVAKLLMSMAVSSVLAQTPTESDRDTLILHADQNGHFSGELTINNVPMPYLIDTGATVTTIPMKYASAANLPLGQQIEIKTAGGRSFGKTTTLKSLKIGPIEIQNIDAHVNPYLSEVLIGMNTLKYFKLVQTADTLSLSINREPQNAAQPQPAATSIASTPPSAPAVTDNTPSRPIKSQVVCDELKHCITRFDNQ